MLKEKICMMMVMMIMGGGQLRDRLESIVKNGCQISGGHDNGQRVEPMGAKQGNPKTREEKRSQAKGIS